MHRKSRMPQIGDMIVETSHGEKHIGLVRDINFDSWGHQSNVYIEWFGDTPRNYHEKHGYGGVNIHNIRDRYEVIRAGVSIP